jgi:hypothetical protein
MKKLIVLLPIVFSLYVSAQKIEVKEDKEDLGGGKNPVLTVVIPEADESDVEKAWKSLMKEYNAKVSSKDGIFADNAAITDISANTVDVYASTKKQDDGIKLMVAIDLGGAFISESTHSVEYKAAEKIIEKFATDMAKKAVAKKLEDAKDKQKELEDNLASLVKKKEKLEKEIEDYKKKIANDEEDIVTNKSDQEKAAKLIEEQKKAVDVIQKKLDDIK